MQYLNTDANNNQISTNLLSSNGFSTAQNLLKGDSGSNLNSKFFSNSNPKYTFVEMVGKGTFGLVYKAKEENGEIVAVKKVYQDQNYNNRELKIMKMIKHKNIINLRNHFFTQLNKKVYLNIIMDYCPFNLYEVIHYYRDRKKKFTFKQIKSISYQIFQALDYLESLKICHRDLKPQNILVLEKINEKGEANFTIKLCDFGSAKVIQDDMKSIAYICSRYYRAPELIFGKENYGNEIDMWSAGCIIAELVLQRPLFKGMSSTDQLIEIIKMLGTPLLSEIKKINPNYDRYKFPLIKCFSYNEIFTKDLFAEDNKRDKEMFFDLLRKILLYDASKRIQANEALEHPFFEVLNKK